MLANYAQRDQDPPDDEEDALDDQEPPEGVEFVDQDQYDDPSLDDAMANLVLPQDSALSNDEARYLHNFDAALESVTLDTCTSCNETDWSRGVVDGVCKRCRLDRGDVRAWSVENNTNPSKYSSFNYLHVLTGVKLSIYLHAARA